MAGDGGAIRFPLGISADRRRIVDADGKPILIQGDATWSMIANLSLDEAREYFDDRRAKGFNAVIINLIERFFGRQAPNTAAGLAPFTTPGDFRTPNEDYMAYAEQILDLALERDFIVFLDPSYLGYPNLGQANPTYPGHQGEPEGWYAEILANGPDGCRAWGEYLAKRFGHYPNLIWVIGGDCNPGDATPGLTAIAEALRAGGVRELFTIHVQPENSPLDQPGIDWVDLNLTYSYQVVHQKLIDDWKREPAFPTLLVEATYEGEHGCTDLQVRRQAWWSVLCGGCGHVFGNAPIWAFGPGWQAAMQLPGSYAMQRWGDFFRGLRWAELVPDLDATIAVSGLGEPDALDRVTVAATPDRRLVIGYLPAKRDLVIDGSALPDSPIAVSWLDPATGEVLDGPPLPARGPVTLTPPFAEDSVLTLTSKVDA